MGLCFIFWDFKIELCIRFKIVIVKEESNLVDVKNFFFWGNLWKNG